MQIKNPYNKSKGFSLIELMISLFLGSVLLAMVIGLYVEGVSNGAKSAKYSRLRTDMQSILTIIETDIRRAGFGGEDFLVEENGNKITIKIAELSEKDCVIYSYNHDPEHDKSDLHVVDPAVNKYHAHDASHEPVHDHTSARHAHYHDHHLDKLGFCYNDVNKTVEFVMNVGGSQTWSQFWSCVFSGGSDCADGSDFVSLSDPDFIKITALTFNETTTSSATATLRNIEINLTGELAADSAYTHSINTTVQVRNVELNEVAPP